MEAMEWGLQNCGNNEGGDEDEVVGGGEGVGFVQVMTDEQMEVLRRQIAAYAQICEQLVEMHKAVTAQQDAIAGMRLGGLYSDSLMTPTGHKISGRQRWTPTSMQLQILENMFDQGIGTPSKQKIKEITLELSQHGHISESNVYNWFQNRRARSKRKQTPTLLNSSEPDTDADADDESTTEKKLRAEQHPRGNQNVIMDSHQLHNFPDNHDLQYITAEHDLQYLPEVQERVKMDISGSYMGYQSGESYDMMNQC